MPLAPQARGTMPMARTRFEWTMITLSFFGGGWVTWTVLEPLAAGAAEDEQRAVQALPSAADFEGAEAAPDAAPPASSDALATSPAPVDDEVDPVPQRDRAPTPGERIQLEAVEGWRKLKERASNSKWKQQITEGVEGTAEKWWSGVREAIGAGPTRATPTPSPTTPRVPNQAPVAAPPAGAPQSQPESDAAAPGATSGGGGQIGDPTSQNGGIRGWLRLLKALRGL